MSFVTNLILTGFFLSEPGEPTYDRLVKPILEMDLGWGQRFVHTSDICEAYGGHKALEHDVFIAAVNYFEPYRLKVALEAIDWLEERETVRLHICPQEQESFSSWTLDQLDEAFTAAGYDMELEKREYEDHA